MAAKSKHRRILVGKIAAIERHNGPDDPRLDPLRIAEAALAISEIRDWSEQAAAALPVFDPSEIAAAGRAAAVIDARLTHKGGGDAD
jgi:hypothetical protein